MVLETIIKTSEIPLKRMGLNDTIDEGYSDPLR